MADFSAGFSTLGAAGGTVEVGVVAELEGLWSMISLIDYRNFSQRGGTVNTRRRTMELRAIAALIYFSPVKRVSVPFLVYWGILMVLCVAWYHESVTCGRCFLSKYVAPFIILGLFVGQFWSWRILRSRRNSKP